MSAADALLAKSCILYDAYQPQTRFIQLNVDPDNANEEILGVVAIQYNGKKKPPEADASVIASFFYQSPDEA